jgi:hypothetical protein
MALPRAAGNNGSSKRGRVAMSELQPSAPATPAALPMLAHASACDEADYALGCECADPALQIPCWGQEARTEEA